MVVNCRKSKVKPDEVKMCIYQRKVVRIQSLNAVEVLQVTQWPPHHPQHIETLQRKNLHAHGMYHN